VSPYLVRELMSFGAEWVSATATCGEAARQMTERNLGTLLVRDDAGLLRGMLTDRDIITRVLAQKQDPEQVQVGAMMTQHPLAMIYDDANLMTAERLMIDRGVRRLVVVRRFDNVVIGVISIDDLAAASPARAGEVVRAAAPTTSAPSKEVPKVVATQQNIILPGETAGETEGGFRASLYSVNDCIRGTVEWIDENDACRGAATKMQKINVGYLPVFTQGNPGRLVGVITDRDLMVRIVAAKRNADNTKVSEIMTKNIACCFSDDNLATAQRVMVEQGVRRLPVISRDNSQVVGILSVDDIAWMASRGRAGSVLKATAYAPPADIAPSARTGGGAQQTAA
jgi:CBS domain-containing protein